MPNAELHHDFHHENFVCAFVDVVLELPMFVWFRNGVVDIGINPVCSHVFID